MTDFKKQAAVEAFKYIRAGQLIGLGAGKTISFLVDEIALHPELANTLAFVSPSQAIREQLSDKGLEVLPLQSVSHIDVYFDGSDQFDNELNALKSGGGIHSLEKILASMASEFILLGDDSKHKEHFNAEHPFTIEVLPDALSIVQLKLRSILGGASVTVRYKEEKPVITQSNNYLVDVQFTQWPELLLLNNIKLLPGVVDHSLFYGLATKAIVCGAEGVELHTKA